MLRSSYHPENQYEIGVDEAGRGPLFGRLYVAAVLPPLQGFENPAIRDSKKIKSEKKLKELSEFIKKNARAWAIHYIEHDVIDKINIRQSVFQGMHECIRQCLNGIDVFDSKILLLIDGNDFKPYSVFSPLNIYNGTPLGVPLEMQGQQLPINELNGTPPEGACPISNLHRCKDDRLMTLPFETIEQGDNEYQAIAAASILAKTARDEYIADLCRQYPELSQRYSLEKNKGYGTRAHLEGIVAHGITQWHRRTYARCTGALDSPLALIKPEVPPAS